MDTLSDIIVLPARYALDPEETVWPEDVANLTPDIGMN